MKEGMGDDGGRMKIVEEYLVEGTRTGESLRMKGNER